MKINTTDDIVKYLDENKEAVVVEGNEPITSDLEKVICEYASKCY